MSFRQYRDIEAGEVIVVAADTATGCGDYCAAQFISKTRLDVPIVYHSAEIASTMTSELYPVLEKICDKTGSKPLVAYERNNGGVFEMERLAALNRLSKYEIFKMPRVGNVEVGETERLGWDTNTASRPAMLDALKKHIDGRLIQIYDIPTINELFSFIVVQTSTTRKAQAEKNAHDDLVMSLAIALKLLEYADADRLSVFPANYNDPSYIPDFKTKRRAY